MLQIFDCAARSYQDCIEISKDYKKFTFFDINPPRMKKSLGLDMIALF